MFPATYPQQYVSAASVTSNSDNEAMNTRSLSDFDSVAVMTVCRVCLATKVKMYLMSENKLSAMYERVTGVELNAENKLPKMLCWECVGRLSSANSFLGKALNTHCILMIKLNSSGSLTMSDIESIDRTNYQLESTLGFQSGVNDIIIRNEEDKNSITETTESDEVLETDNASNISEVSEEINQLVDKTIDSCEVLKQRGKIKQDSATLNSGSEALPHCKDRRVVVEDKMLTLSKCNTQDYPKQLTANVHTSTDISNGCCPQVKNKSFDNIVQTITTDTDTIEKGKYIDSTLDNIHVENTRNIGSGIIDAVHSNITIIPNETETTKNLFICDICNKPFHRRSTLIHHIRKRCFKKDLRAHINCEHDEGVSCYKCHTDIQHTKQKVYNVHVCSFCSYKACRKADLTRHVNAKHTKTNVHNCSLCSYKTYQKATLARHVNAIHTKTNVYNCSLCDYKAHQKADLTTHVNAIHTKTNVYNCSLCSYTAYRKSVLARHVNAIHTKTNVYNCSFCDYKSFHKVNLARHVNAIHTKADVYNCSLCDYKAYQKGDLTAHVNAKHTKTNIYNCSHCNYKSYKKADLTTHVNAIHTKTDVYNCSFCSYKAYRRADLTRHFKTKH